MLPNGDASHGESVEIPTGMHLVPLRFSVFRIFP